MEIKLLFMKTRSFYGMIVRAALMSKYNHVAIQLGNVIYESHSLTGVRARESEDYPYHDEVGLEITYEVSEEEFAIIQDFLNRQLGKPYDMRAIYGIPFRRNWQEDDAWFCSELIAAAFEKAGAIFHIDKGRVTPRDLLFFMF